MDDTTGQGLLSELRDQIKIELETVRQLENPFVYAQAQTSAGIHALVDRIEDMVVTQGLGIDECIAAIETENNPNKLD